MSLRVSMSSWLNFGLLGAHVLQRADHLAELGEQRLLGQLLRRGLGHAEVDHLGHRRGRRTRPPARSMGLMSRWMMPF